MRETLQLPQRDILLFFGSFDPITLGHEAVIDAGLKLIQPESIILVPAAQQGWGKKLSSFENRTNMIGIAASAHRGWKGRVSASSLEKDRELSGVTAESMHILTEELYPNKRFGFLMGSDWIVSFTTWQEWKWMLSVAPAFVAMRGDESIDTLLPKLHKDLLPYINKQVFFIPEEVTKKTKKVSSTSVRSSVNQNGFTKSVRPQILEFIQTNGLYHG